MVKFQVNEADRQQFPEWIAGQWVLYVPGEGYHFRDTEEAIDTLMKAIKQVKELGRTRK
mgnify:FL=1